MQIIKAPSVAERKAVDLPNGTVYTWGNGHFFYMACSEGIAVCLNTGDMTRRETTNANAPVRIVKGAFHTED